MKGRMSAAHLSMIAFCAVLNIVGGQIALLLRLPIYLDSIGTVLAAATMGPLYGMLPSLLSGVLLGVLSDIYSLYYAPGGILLGWLGGMVGKTRRQRWWWPFAAAGAVTVPSSFVSACITAYLFGGITSSGSSALVLLLANTPLGLTLSCFLVQVLSDYLDRVLAFFIVMLLLKRLPLRRWQG